ncbi:coiled-coil domain-containing 113-like [Octopus vulgaris]|uniref:Coiled-coil domain-containing 113-like n=1 Tax=Octopus vulgaris TaxID=6645 RepID=A0AA36BK99_OCTVU|nr:coiled-coil domain-containing 113-like [Octopus vulgaris]
MEELQCSLDVMFPVKPKWKRMWQMGTVSTLTAEEITEKLEKTEKEIQFLSKETPILEKYLGDKIVSSASGSGEESSSGIGSQIRSQPMSPLAIAARALVRTKPGSLTVKQKLIIAKYCQKVYKDELKTTKDITREFIESSLALIENYQRTLADIESERREMEVEFGDLVKAGGKIPFLHKWQKYVTAKNIKYESFYSTTKLRNAGLNLNIKKQIMIKKYRNEVDPVEFYSKWLEKNTLKEETQNIIKQKSRLRKALVPIERYTYEKKQELEKNVNQGEDFRKRILREKHSLSYLLNKHRDQEEARQEEEALNKQLNTLSETYRVPSVLEANMENHETLACRLCGDNHLIEKCPNTTCTQPAPSSQQQPGVTTDGSPSSNSLSPSSSTSSSSSSSPSQTQEAKLERSEKKKRIQGRCFKCHRMGHYARDCYSDRCYQCHKSGHLAKHCFTFVSRCYVCNQLGHVARQCNQQEILSGCCYNCGQQGHVQRYCPNLIYRTCYRCGETGHVARKCVYLSGSTNNVNNNTTKLNGAVSKPDRASENYSTPSTTADIINITVASTTTTVTDNTNITTTSNDYTINTATSTTDISATPGDAVNTDTTKDATITTVSATIPSTITSTTDAINTTTTSTTTSATDASGLSLATEHSVVRTDNIGETSGIAVSDVQKEDSYSNSSTSDSEIMYCVKFESSRSSSGSEMICRVGSSEEDEDMETRRSLLLRNFEVVEGAIEVGEQTAAARVSYSEGDQFDIHGKNPDESKETSNEVCLEDNPSRDESLESKATHGSGDINTNVNLSEFKNYFETASEMSNPQAMSDRSIPEKSSVTNSPGKEAKHKVGHDLVSDKSFMVSNSDYQANNERIVKRAQF